MTGGYGALSEKGFSRVRDILQQYFPFILLGIGLVMIFSAGVAAYSSGAADDEVVFQTQDHATDSGSLIRVDVAGAVLHPGVYSFSFGSRISDAIDAASGFSTDADSEWVAKNLNRAAKLVDGGKIYIPSHEEKNTGMVAGVETQNLATLPSGVNINRGSQGELEALPGIGPVTAQKIISARPYQTVEEIKTKKILGPAAFEKVKHLLTL